jgi:hypothetical protein
VVEVPASNVLTPSDGFQFWAGPVGGAIIGLLFFPTGCTVDDFPCPDGEMTNWLGWTMGGWVGNVDKAGAFFLGLVVAAVTWGVLSLLRREA